MPLQVLAIALLLLAILLVAYASSREENYRQHLKPRFGIFLAMSFGLLITGVILLFISVGWKWGLLGLVASWLMVFIVGLMAEARKHVDDPTLVRRVTEINNIKEEHQAELEHFDHSISPEKAASLMVSFLDELRLNFPREFRQLNPEILPDLFRKDFQKSIIQAYMVGYMQGKGWVTQEHMADFVIHSGDHLAQDIEQTFKAKSNGDAFASGYTAVSASGCLAALQESSDSNSQEFLEESMLSSETFEFLVEITPKTLQAEHAEKQVVPQDQLSRIKEVEDKLRYFAEDSTKALHAGKELLERIQKAYNDNDFWQVIGWIRWFMLLQTYTGKYLLDSDTNQETRKQHYDGVIEILKTTADAARQENDFDALLLAAGLCSWLGLAKWSNETLEIVRSEIGEEEITRRLTNIKQKPRMFVDELLVRQLERH